MTDRDWHMVFIGTMVGAAGMAVLVILFGVPWMGCGGILS